MERRSGARRAAAPRGSRTRAWAAAAVLLLLIPAASGIQHWLQPPRPRPLGEIVPAFVRLNEGGERSQRKAQVITLPTHGPLLLQLHVPILEDQAIRYAATLTGPEGTPLWTRDRLQSLDAFGTFMVVLDSARLAAGSYELVVQEVDAPSGEIRQRFEFTFDLRR